MENKKKIHKLPSGEACYNSYFYDYKRSAEDRNIEFKITIDDFKRITKRVCFYCGDKPKEIIKKNKRLNGSCIANGIDRLNNSLGYVLDNCVPCCKLCNYMKWKSTTEEFIEKINKIYKRHSKERKKIVYCCGVDFQHELGEVPDHTKVYSSVEDLKRQRTCWDECGIVEVEVKLIKWTDPQDFSHARRK